MQRKFRDYLIVSLKGMAMGAADVVPGVSGGTIAFISGIYEELIESIDNLKLSVFTTWKKEGFKSAWKSINGPFLISLFMGIAISIISLAKVIRWLLVNETVLLWSFFFGLVLASIIFIGKQIKSWNIINVVAIIVAAGLSYWITIVEPFASPESYLYLMFCGFIAIIAMILPGISGAFILLLLGAYQTAIMTVDDLVQGIMNGDFELFKKAFLNFLMLGIGAIIGIKSFSKLLNWLFKNYKNFTLALLTGFMIGSLNKIWPWKKTLSFRTNSHGEEVPFMEESVLPYVFEGNPKIWSTLLLMLVGFLTIAVLEKLSNNSTD